MKTQQYRMVDIWRQLAYPNTLPGEDLDRVLNDPVESSETRGNRSINERLARVLKRQIECLYEEMNELETAQTNSNKKEIIDGYCDAIWVTMMICSIIDFDPSEKVKVLLDEKNYKFGLHFTKLKENLNSINERFTEIDDKAVRNQFEQMLSAMIYRCTRGLEYELSNVVIPDLALADSDQQNSIYWAAVNCFNEVVFSNFTKIVDGKLPLDETGKITKSMAKARGTYLEPDFSRYL